VKKTEDQIQIKILGLLEINANGKMAVLLASIVVVIWQILSNGNGFVS
jgi:hypothetical protein